METKWEQESKSGTRKATKTGQRAEKDPKVGPADNKVGTNWEELNPKVGSEEQQSEKRREKKTNENKSQEINLSEQRSGKK